MQQLGQPRQPQLIRTFLLIVLALAHAPANTLQASGSSTTQHRVAPGSTPQHRVAPDSTSQHRVAPESTPQHRVAPDSTSQHRVAPESTPQHRVAPDSTPLPDVSAFTAQVRARLRTDRALQAQYTFLERREEITVSKLGKVKDGPVKIYEVYPSEDPGNLWKRLISVNGTPLSAAELAHNDAVHQKDIFARLNESPAQKARRAREAAKERAEDQRMIDELFAVYDITLVRREIVNGHPTILAALEPRRTYKPRTDEGKVMRKVRARAWIHETEHQIVRVETEALEDIGFGFGVVGKIYKGTVGEFVRTKVNGEVWLPARARFTAKGRALFRKFAIDSVTEWWDYKKFSVSTREETR